METASFETITPAIAERLLKKNLHNRHKRASRIELYAREMIAGRWVKTNHGIGIGADGELYDGQHTLHAVIKSGCSISTLVVRGLSPAAKDAIDTGVSRSTHDVQNLTEPDARMTKWEVSSARTLNNIVFGEFGAFLVSDLREVRDLFSAAYDAMHAVFGTKRIVGVTVGPVFAALVLAHADCPDKVVAAADDLRTGAGLNITDPILVLRNKLMSMKNIGGASFELELFDRTLIAVAARISGWSRVMNKVPEGGAVATRARFIAANGLEAER